MTKQNRSPNAKSARRCDSVWLFGFRYSFGFGHSSFGFENGSSRRLGLSRRGPEAAAFHDGDQAVHANVANDIDATANPVHPDLLDCAALAQTKMEPFPKITLVTASAVDLVDLGQVASDDRHSGADAVAVGFCAAELNLNPVIGPARVVSQNGRLTPRVEYDDVQIPIVIQVVERRPAAAEPGQQSIAALVGYIHEPSLASVPQNDVSGVVTGGVIKLLHVVDEVTAGNENIAVAVVVQINHAGAPFDVRIGAVARAGLAGHILKIDPLAVLVERAQLAMIRRDIKIQPAVVVPVGAFHTHRALDIAKRVVSQSQEGADLFELASAVILQNKIGAQIVSHNDVCVAVIVEVGADHAHARAQERRDAGGSADIGEGSIPVVAIEHVRRRRVMQGTDVSRKSVHVRNLVVLESESHVVGHEQVQIPVTIHIQETGAGADVVSHGHSGLSGDIGKGPIPVVPIKDVRPEIIQVDIRVAVVVIIAHAHTQMVIGI